MATLLATFRSTGTDGTVRADIAGAYRTFKRSLDEEMLRRRSEALLQSLDKRILLDAGIGSQGEEKTETELDDRRNELSALRLLFSWTRFAK
jgi:hypothetical protein